VPAPPDGGWGWVILIASFLTNVVVDGVSLSFGIMQKEIINESQGSINYLMYNLALGIQLAGTLLLGKE